MLIACGGGTSTKSEEKTSEMPPISTSISIEETSSKKEETIYDLLNNYKNASYNSLDFTITNSFEEGDLLSSYIVRINGEEISINYSYQEFNTFDLESPEPIDEAIVTKSGSVTYKGGQVKENEGDEINISFRMLDLKKLNFDESYFNNVSYNTDSFQADVINPSNFINMGDINEVHIEATYSLERFNTISLNFMRNNHQVYIEINL